MPYDKIPTPQQWGSDVEGAAKASLKLLPDADRIGWILDLLEQYASGEKAWRGTVAVYLFHATYYWLKKANTKPKTGPQLEVRFVGSDVAKPMAELKAVCASQVAEMLDLEPGEGADYDKQLLVGISEMFGKTNSAAEADSFLRSKKDSGLIYLTEDADRMRYKVKFRKGLLFRCAALVGENGAEWVPYDSEKSGESERSDGMVHFAMDHRGRLYLGYRPAKDVKFVHSSLVGGEPVLCAGKMKVKEGQLREVNDDSGHYQPLAKQMALMLNQLQIHGVPLEPVVVLNARSGAKILAVEIIKTRKWPD
jgi:hypothetical protein